jgi:DNA polymerase-3 subunit alpha
VDKFRKAVGKKIPKEMAEQKEKFINGCVNYSHWSLKKAEELWTWIEPFAAYGFNKAHSVSYGLIAYQTAYLKANFPAEYMASVLTHHGGDVEKVAESVTECKSIGIAILPPDVNESFEDFTVIKQSTVNSLQSTVDAKDSIRFGLTTIKNFGEGIAEAIITERKENGKFKSLEDFLRRIKDKNLNKKSLESLIKAGALDSLSDKHTDWRETLLFNLENLLTFSKEQRNESTTQDSLFGSLSDSIASMSLHLEKIPEKNISQNKNESMTNQLMWEKELLGLYISGHPLDQFKERLEKQNNTIKNIKDNLKTTTSTENNVPFGTYKKPKGKEVVVAGIIEELKDVTTKKGDQMVFMRLADLTGSIETVIFPRVYEEFRDILAIENCVVIKGTVSERNNEKSILVDKIKVLE